MEAAPVMRYHLEFLASRLAWSRLLPGLALLVVGMTQPFAVIETDGRLESTLSLSEVIDRSDTLENGTAAAVVVWLLVLVTFVLAAQAVSAINNRSERARQVTVALAIAVLVLGLAAVITIGSLEPMVDAQAEDEPVLGLTAQGPVPLLLGAAGVWIAAARAKRPERLVERSVQP